ncbi:MAG: SH3 domain-containing protein [Candidatus Omnitrophica bacterium]|nr:SH3 domain-containing protein [Candidatus Omnitrophota bacterium]
MIKKICSSLLILCLFFTPGCDNKERVYYSSPGVIPNTHRQMKSAGFWISRQPFTDKVILDPAGIASFNSKTEKELKLTRDPSKVGPLYSGEELTSSLTEEMRNIFDQKLYSQDARRIGKLFYQKMKERINLEVIPSQINVRYGLICRYADQRTLPTEEIVTTEPGDVDFDELQNSSLDTGTPLAILHETKDGAWVYAHSPASSGWIMKDRIAFCGAAELKNYLEKTPFLIVTGAKADIFLDNGLTQYLDYVRMGARFPCIAGFNSEVIQISIPFQAEGGKFAERAAYIRRSDVNFGYLAYTSRNIMQQAFKLLNAPYAWGGKNGEQDCSSFLQEVFSTTGIALPRNSSDQGKVGRSLGEFTEKTGDELKMHVLKDQAIAGVAIMQLNGHIFLYLGMYEDRPYVIHETHAYRQRMWWGGDIAREVNRVVVSDLSLGKGSQKGSLLERIISIRNVN